MESLTDSLMIIRGDGSSSLHASSFTPGTSPTSLSSLVRIVTAAVPVGFTAARETAQESQKHRQPGQVCLQLKTLPRKRSYGREGGVGKNRRSRKDQEEIEEKDKRRSELRGRAEAPKTPPSNLSPIEMPPQRKS
ncbi:hypothetical protein DPEC_G00115190 [Dallia pectoralis]|uniref:Uncharacterized protein n=1 Tax=Dallia pectoralis TaxID=75939 RepID=A0ACC2GUH9_DALPE|nr:hypothetical protein DPEC_G00115190 [Dallia pectoralis]